jgi:hypothetical protein
MKRPPTLKQKVRKFQKASGKAVDATKKGVAKFTNINRYNKYLFIFETILFVGVIDEFFEGVITGFNLGIYLHILLLMFSIGILFTIALNVIESITKGTIVWLVRLSNNKILRVVVHLIIFAILFYLYGKVFFDTNISLSFNIGLNAT